MQLSMPTILAAALLVFMRAFADFGTPLLIGEGYRTFPVEIYNQYLGENGTNHNFAAAISVIAIVVTAMVFFLQKFLTKRYNFSISALHPVQKKKLQEPIRESIRDRLSRNQRRADEANAARRAGQDQPPKKKQQNMEL